MEKHLGSVWALAKNQFFPQIAGSYRGSYFSKVGLLITEIAAAPSLPSSFVSLHLSPCMLITEIAAAPSLPSSFVSLHLSPCMLITEIAAAPSLPSSFVSLHLSPCMLIPKITASSFVSLPLSPCMLIPKISLLHLSPFICLPSFVSRHADSQSPCMISILGCSWLLLPPPCFLVAGSWAAQMLSGVYAGIICPPSFVSLHLSPGMLIPNLPAC